MYKIYLEKEINIIAYYKLLLDLNKSKFENKFLSKLRPLIFKLYNKEVEFNIVSNGSWTAGFSALVISEDYKRKFPGGIKTVTKIKVPQRTLNSLLENEMKDITSIDIMSIDIEGGELNLDEYEGLEVFVNDLGQQVLKTPLNKLEVVRIQI